MLKRLLRSNAGLSARLAASALLVCGAAGAATAQTDYAAIEATPALWSISDADSTVYLFGTVHILPPELNWRTDAIEAALDGSERVYFEADVLSPQAQAEAQALIPQLGQNAAGVTLSSLISDTAKDHVAVIAGRIGAPPEAFMAQMDPLQPWLASVSMAVLQMRAGGYDPAAGVEAALHAQAQATGKAFGYFETVEEQLRFLADAPIEIQVADFEIGVEQMVEEPEMLTELVQAWAAGDTDYIDRVFNDDMRDVSPQLYDRLIVQRNRNWIPQIEAALAGADDVFVAVGAGHMPGSEGVIALLEAQGYTVERQ
jgi:uncharacterized protein YbaP (TraB family)